MALQHIDNLWKKLQSLVITQYKESTNLLSMIEKVTDCFQDIEDSSYRLANFANIEEADGNWLDIIGKLRNLPRDDGESDKSYRDRLKILFKQSTAGTPQNIIQNAADLSKDRNPQYLDEVDGVFFVYTPKGKQLSRKTVASLAPAGVLGLPGASFRLTSGKALATVEQPHKLILAVAQDKNIIDNGYLSSEQGLPLLTEDGRHIIL
ncbi:DUF2612 domain-containing protein [Fibrobacter sp. UWH1]|uniref:DUF2612 domain-containing protein n=1 Tax=Fibrobacter sp. UWH1 TaxID=1964354 RepID=UPI000B521E83|nr:DUF2612 domain-containing protein [Fibrobacter sp. UWH1]OWV12078.1 hypothetical protein B7992_09380 [Fibrobacter sp. UWH1]